MFFTEEEKKVWFKFKVWYIRPEQLEALMRYRDQGIDPGGFLYFILANDFVEASNLADHENLGNFAAYARFLYEMMPRSSWGSYDNVKRWIEKGGWHGRKNVYEDKKDGTALYRRETNPYHWGIV